MIIDCFPFHDELDVLEIRLNTLAPHVDYFVLVESSKTQSGLDKPFYFDQNKERYAEFQDKVVHVKYHEYCSLCGWNLEHYQRDRIHEGLNRINPDNSDIVLISDVDEIPDLERVEVKKLPAQPITIKMQHHAFFSNLYLQNAWLGTVVSPYHKVAVLSPQGLRGRKDAFPNNRISSGWHLAYLGGKESVWKKWHSCIEPLDKSVIPPHDKFCDEFDRKIRDGGSFLFSDKEDDLLALVACPIEYPHLPKYLVENQEKFKHLFWK